MMCTDLVCQLVYGETQMVITLLLAGGGGGINGRVVSLAQFRDNISC